MFLVSQAASRFLDTTIHKGSGLITRGLCISHEQLSRYPFILKTQVNFANQGRDPKVNDISSIKRVLREVSFPTRIDVKYFQDELSP